LHLLTLVFQRLDNEKEILPGLENKDGIVLLDSMASHFSGSSLETLVGKWLKPEPDAVEGCSLSGISYPPLNVVEMQELSFFRFGTLQRYID
jgi:hypothetical protein